MTTKTATYDVRYPAFDGTQPCASEDPELFFPSSSRESWYSEMRRKDLCAACPFQRPCLAYAITHNVNGYWAGTHEPERDRIRKEHGITAVTPFDFSTVIDNEGRIRLSEPTLTDRGGASATEVATALGVSSRTVVRRRARRRDQS